jgi:hypothetical protein
VTACRALYENAERRRSSLRRWLRELEACGLVRTAVVYDDDGQERGVDVELRPCPELDAEELAHAAERLVRGAAATATASSSPSVAPAPSSAASSNSARDRDAHCAPPPRPSRCCRRI